MKLHIVLQYFQNLLLFKSIHLILVGNGILESQLKTLAKGKPYIHFLPFQNQSIMPLVYRLGSIFCLPSQGPGETWGLALNEALACKRKIIASNKVGGAIDLIKEGINGSIFKSNNKDSLKSAITLAMIKNIKINEITYTPISINQNVNILINYI